MEARLKQGGFVPVSVPSVLTPAIFPRGRVGAPVANLCNQQTLLTSGEFTYWAQGPRDPKAATVPKGLPEREVARAALFAEHYGLEAMDAPDDAPKHAHRVFAKPTCGNWDCLSPQHQTLTTVLRGRAPSVQAELVALRV